MAKLTKRFVDAQKPGAKQRHIYDEETPGFVLTVAPDGRKTFGVRYGPRDRRKWMTLGAYGTLTVDEARDRARRILAAALAEKDPATSREAKRAVPTFGEWAADYLADSKLTRKQPRLIAIYLARCEKWERTPLDEISSLDVAALFREQSKRGRVLANRWLTTVRAVFQRAVKQKLLTANPCDGIEANRENPGRTRVLQPDEIKRILAAVEDEDPHVRAAVWLLFETGRRLGEVLGAKWTDLDLRGGLWRLPDTKSGRPQDVELAASTAEWLTKVPRVGPYVIASRDPQKPRYDLKSAWERICTRAGVKGAHIHDIRRTVSAALIRARGIYAAGEVLGHSNIAVTASHYSGRAPGERREALESVVIPFLKRAG